MKYAVLLVLLTAILPASILLRRHPLLASKAWIAVGFLPFVLQIVHLNMAIFSWADWSLAAAARSSATIEWPGYTHALEFSALDALALSLYLSLPRMRHPLPFKLSMALYFIAVLLSALQAPVPLATFFYAWQLARMFLVYVVVTRASAVDPRVAPALLLGMALGVFLEVPFTLWQRFELGLIQTSGTVTHQNFLG